MSKRIKYLEINLIQEVKYLYTEGNKTLMEQIGKDTNKKMSQVYGLDAQIYPIPIFTFYFLQHLKENLLGSVDWLNYVQACRPEFGLVTILVTQIGQQP